MTWLLSRPISPAPAPVRWTPRRSFTPAVLLLALSATVLASAPDATQPSAAQSNTMHYNAQSSDSGQASVSGTSTLHDWTVVKSSKIIGSAVFLGQWKSDSVPSIALQSISLAMPVNSIKSTEGSGMDNTMYEAFEPASSIL